MYWKSRNRLWHKLLACARRFSREARVPQAAAQVPAPVKVDGIGPMSREDYDHMGGESGATKLRTEIFPGQEVEQERLRKWKESLNAGDAAEEKRDTA